MPIEIKLPMLGENLEGGEVLDVRVTPGTTVSQGQTLVEVEAEKATVEVPSTVDGQVTQVTVKKGDRIKVGQTLCFIEGNTNGGPPAMPVEAKASTEAPKAALKEPAPAKEEEPAPVTPVNRLPPEPKRAEAAPTVGDDKLVPAGPATRRLARELGIELRLVAGSGPHGRVTQDDVKGYVKQLASGSAPTAARTGGGIAAPPLPDFEKWGPIEKKPLEGIRKMTANQMAVAWSQIPHVTQNDEADITDLEAFRKQHEAKGKDVKPRLTVTAFALKAAAILLRQMPQFNTSLDMAGGQLVSKKYVHIGVAVDTDRGLLVPVLRNVDQKSVFELATELGEIAERARQKKVPVEEMKGGCFTITNLGGIGGTGFTPIVNWPEVAILGMSRARLTPVYREGELVPRLMLPLSLSYDHRVIDGADAARFTRRLAEMLEKPMLMLLHA
jgi:pyruvate dehydrogenase E2 component (dihydrolipoamide acetyltransferase)